MTLAKPYWHPSRRSEVFESAVSNKPSGPRQGDSKVQLVRQGVRGALRAKNLRLLIEAAPAPENLAMLAELPLERLFNMADGALCSDETAYHLEQQLRLQSGWLDRNNHGVPEEVRERLKRPDEVHADEDNQERHVDTGHMKDKRPVRGRDLQPPAGESLHMAKTLVAQATTTGLSAPENREPADVSTAPPRAPAGLPAALPESTTRPLFDDGATKQASVAELPLLTTNAGVSMKAAHDLRRHNLSILLEGKGSKSALARLIKLSPASVTSMLNGGKSLEKDFCNSIAHTLKLSENWFETERTSADVPDAVKKKLAPLPRGTAVPGPDEPRMRSAAAAPASSSAAPVAPSAPPVNPPAPVQARASAERPQSWPASASKVSKVKRLTSPDSAASQVASSGETATPNAALPRVATPSTREQDRALPPAQRGDTLPASSSGFVVEGGLSPITEALIKTLAQKARQGSLSEDRAFEMLGAVRAL